MTVMTAALSVSLAAHLAWIAAAPPDPPRALTTGPTAQWIEFTNVTQDVGSEAAVITPNSPGEPAPHRAAIRPHEGRVKVAQSAPSTALPTKSITSTSTQAPRSVAHFMLAPSSQWSAKLATAAAIDPIALAPAPESALDVVAERDVSTRAKLRSAAEVSYPADARAAEIEADVPVEIVVDAHGAVADARVLARSGYGLDDAALRAIRKYRFDPAVRDGRRVSVRMHWQVSFRLR